MKAPIATVGEYTTVHIMQLWEMEHLGNFSSNLSF
jgi:hypothetical protein